MGRRVFWHTRDRPDFFSETWQKSVDSYQWRSMEIFLPIYALYLLILRSQLHSKWSDLWRWHLVSFFIKQIYILPQFNRISPSCVKKTPTRYHFMCVKGMFRLKEVSGTFFLSSVNLSDYNKICKLINYCVPIGPPSLLFFLISSLAYILSKVYILKNISRARRKKTIHINAEKIEVHLIFP